MPTVDLPAHNVCVNEAAPGSYAEIVGTGEALSAMDGEYVRFNWAEGRTRLLVGKVWVPGSGFVSAEGFGLWTPPEGAVITDVRFVAHGYINNISEDPAVTIDEATYFAHNGAGSTHSPLVRYPMVLVNYAGAPFTGAYQGYNLSSFPWGSALDIECALPLVHLIDGADYVIAGIGDPDTGTFGLQPEILMPEYPPAGTADTDLVLMYLAIRITYSVATTRHIRAYPRDRRAYPHSRGQRGYPAQP